MGTYDTLPKGSQVKCWDCNFSDIKIGSEVGTIHHFQPRSYVVLLSEGGYLRIINGTVVDIVEDQKPRTPEDFPDEYCFNKWGVLILDKKGVDGYYSGKNGGLERSVIDGLDRLMEDTEES